LDTPSYSVSLKRTNSKRLNYLAAQQISGLVKPNYQNKIVFSRHSTSEINVLMLVTHESCLFQWSIRTWI